LKTTSGMADGLLNSIKIMVVGMIGIVGWIILPYLVELVVRLGL